MRRTSRLFLLGALILVLLTAACATEEGVTPTTFPGTSVPGEEDLTGTATTEPLETATGEGTATGAETATGELQTPAISVADGTATATSTQSAGTTTTPGIPVTGPEVVLVECQFCVDTRAHALLVLPDTATFEIVSPAPSTTTSTTAADTESRCSTVEVNNGKQVVLCSGPEMTPLVVNICTDANTCTDFPIDLLACPLTQAPGLNQSTPDAGSVTIRTATSPATTTTPTTTTPTNTPTTAP